MDLQTSLLRLHLLSLLHAHCRCLQLSGAGALAPQRQWTSVTLLATSAVMVSMLLLLLLLVPRAQCWTENWWPAALEVKAPAAQNTHNMACVCQCHDTQVCLSKGQHCSTHCTFKPAYTVHIVPATSGNRFNMAALANTLFHMKVRRSELLELPWV
jgi:hypothetical protein